MRSLPTSRRSSHLDAGDASDARGRLGDLGRAEHAVVVPPPLPLPENQHKFLTKNFGTITLRDSLQSLPMQSIFYRVSHLPVERGCVTFVFQNLPHLTEAAGQDGGTPKLKSIAPRFMSR